MIHSAKRFLLSGAMAVIWMLAASLHAAPPNIVLIISDDQAWTDYGFMGHAEIETPRLDKLAGESLVFPRGYVPSSVCCPSLASLVTGLYPHQHKITSNDPPLGGAKGPARYQTAAFKQGREKMASQLEQVATLPKLLAGHGYLSFQSGKWWQGHFSRGGFTHGMTTGQRHGDAGLEIGRKTMRPIHDFIATAKREEKPFLVWYAPLMPHDPHTPPADLLAKYRETTASIHVARYRAMVEWFDRTCGELLDDLDEQGVAENTIVVYLCDNGWIQNPGSPHPPLRSKMTQYDAGLRTPIMIRWPGKIEPVRRDKPVTSVDLMPTLLKAVGVPVPAGLPGIDLTDAAAVDGREFIPGACFTHDAVDLDVPASSLRYRWITDGRHKLIVPHAANVAGGKVEFYDVVADPHETSNLAPEAPPSMAGMRAALDAWWNP
ncbi:sulfatase family protein [Luteolibacter marinus]|uniref:sulfatase family protein n=1 Tax=Luteolibacter marinus TaxID=2776705 RepID=UPI001865D927|nr:sulfatase [Luteolibacter marinus]